MSKLPLIVTIIILSAIAYRTARFIVLDTLIEETRDKVHAHLASHPSMLNLKLQELLGCPYCVTIWTSAFATVFWSLVVDRNWYGWAFIGVWLSAATGALVLWTYIDSEDED